MGFRFVEYRKHKSLDFFLLSMPPVATLLFVNTIIVWDLSFQNRFPKLPFSKVNENGLQVEVRYP